MRTGAAEVDVFALGIGGEEGDFRERRLVPAVARDFDDGEAQLRSDLEATVRLPILGLVKGNHPIETGAASEDSNRGGIVAG